MNIQFLGCAPRNFRKGRSIHQIEAVVIHLIDGSQGSCDSTFLNNLLDNPVSAHYSISKKGEIHQYVEEQDTAFHAGKIVRPVWPDLKRGDDNSLVNPNLYAIGIEHEGRPNDDWPDQMYAASALLLQSISARHPKLATLSERNVALHRQIRADKSCPGFKFDLQRLLREAALPMPTTSGTPGAVLIVKNVNLRSGRPSVQAPIVRVIAKDNSRPIDVIGFVTGDEVNGNNIWYRTIEDNYFWAGATADPNP
ncbi:MAG: N-acetylmuramoyl-L-alanine amidase [Acidobacteria bacterium]|nr:N-acetylmuramoyl-L-alanine amidase [Acidobacteriota bacterium]